MKQALSGKHAKLNPNYISLALDEQTYAILYAYVHILIYQLCLKIDIIEYVYAAHMHMVWYTLQNVKFRLKVDNDIVITRSVWYEAGTTC